MISQNDKSSLFSQHREKYIENKLNNLKEKDPISKGNKSMKQPNLNIVGLGNTFKYTVLTNLMNT